MGSMAHRSLYQRLRQNGWVRTCLFALGCLCLVLTPIIGVLPGPGGLILLPLGLALVLQNSQWAKRVYGRFKRKHPRYAARADWLMRRPSALRKSALEKAKRAKDGN
jgi:hypothetical protein